MYTKINAVNIIVQLKVPLNVLLKDFQEMIEMKIMEVLSQENIGLVRTISGEEPEMPNS